MSKRQTTAVLLILVLVLASCASGETPQAPTAAATSTELPPPTSTVQVAPTAGDAASTSGILFSELLPGVRGVDNTLEFIELYNASPESIELQGWSISYLSADDSDEKLVYAWEGPALVPGYGHWLLVRSGKDVGALPDSEFDVSLFELKGGLALRSSDGSIVDTLVWGDGPSTYREGSPVAAPTDGASLERLPGGPEGNGADTDDNSADFAALVEPSPQNSGALRTPLPSQRLDIRLNAPPVVLPGSDLEYVVEIENHTGNPVEGAQARIPIPDGFEIVSLPDEAQHSGGWVDWILPLLGDGSTVTGVIRLQSPWTYTSTIVRDYFVQDSSGGFPAYGPLQVLAVEGGAIPIAAARTLKGQTVTVDGIATMFTGGYYAGSSGTKFYMEDESGGIQVYCPGGRGLVQVGVGDLVRVTGEIDVYRDSLEIIPFTYPDDVEVLQPAADLPEPTTTTVSAATRDEDLLGRLITVEGTATRIEEFTYSYEVDLMDDEGTSLLAYVDKESGVSAEPLDVGSLYRVTGISEIYDGTWQIKPRFQTDFSEVFPPVLLLDLNARNSVEAGGVITYTLTAQNHTLAPLTNVVIEAAAPAAEAEVTGILDGGTLDGSVVSWAISEVTSSAAVQVRYVVQVDDSAAGPIVVEAALATADQWLEPAESDAMLTFVGSGVPIWAIQGPGESSPYVRDHAATGGIVTGVFPDLGGFWIQEPETDDNPATSAGLFVMAEEGLTSLQLGDEVRVSGQVRELSGQTLLDVNRGGEIMMLSTGNVLPTAVDLNPPADTEEAIAYYEPLEGMLARVGQPAVAVGPTSKYGETPLVLQDWGIDRIMRGEPRGMLIFVDDGGSATHNDLSTMAFPLKTGDLLLEAVGPLAYTYENYKIEPISLPTVEAFERPLPRLEPTESNELSIATFNVENLFDTLTPHPGDLELPSQEAYALDLAKMASTILDLGAPTIIGLQEVENLDILEDLVKLEAISSYDYQPFLVEGTDSRGIDVGYLVRGDRAEVTEASAHPAPEGLTSRPPLLLKVNVHLDRGDRTLYLLNNHFTSMSGGELPTEPRRKAQAAWNRTLVEEILAADPDANVVVMGDLNSFYDSPPMDLLREGGLRHVYESVEPVLPYTYIFQGDSETLDHILVSPTLFDHLARVVALHINADYPPPIPGDESSRHASDHDPLLAIFAFD